MLQPPSSPEALSINRRDFGKALTLLSRIVKPRGVKPALTWVILESRGDELCLTGYDFTVALELRLPGLGASLPRIAVSLERLRRIQSSIESSCELRLAEDRLQVLDAGRLRGELALEDWREQFPTEILDWPNANVCRPCPWLAPSLALAQLFVARESTRYAITNVSVEFADRRSRVSATDGRLLYAEEFPGWAGKPAQCLIPGSPVYGLPAIQEGITEVGFTATELFLSGSRLRLRTRLGNGIFPDVDRVLPRRIEGPLPLSPTLREHLHRKLKHFPEQVLLVVDAGQAAIHPVGARMEALPLESTWEKLQVRLKVNRDFLRTCLSVPVDGISWEQQPGPLVLTGEHGRRRVLLMPIGD